VNEDGEHHASVNIICGQQIGFSDDMIRCLILSQVGKPVFLDFGIGHGRYNSHNDVHLLVGYRPLHGIPYFLDGDRFVRNIFAVAHIVENRRSHDDGSLVSQNRGIINLVAVDILGEFQDFHAMF
jgi:hypothetical protein